MFLILLLAVVPGAFAQPRAYYVDLDRGVDSGPCEIHSPCTFAYAWGQQSDGSLFLIRVPGEGDTVQVPAPTTPLTKKMMFGPYTVGLEPEEGTLEFTGNFRISPGGEFLLERKAKAQFADITLESGSRTTDLFGDNDASENIVITGTLTIPDGESVLLHGLTVFESFTVRGGIGGGQASSLRIAAGGLTVNSGATLSLDDVDLVVHAKRDGVTVDGTIVDVTKEKSRSVWIAYLNVDGGEDSRGATLYSPSVAYRPRFEGFDEYDCIRIRGTGTIRAGIFAIATGNLCVELKRVGPVTVSGSIQNDVYTREKITTDLIFREDVIVEGDVAQWNDARIVFEKTAEIQGDVILRDGGTPYTNTADYGEANTASDSGIRRGWPLDGTAYTCAYSNARRRDRWDHDMGTHHIPGVQFEGVAMIAGNLNVYSSTLTETTTAATQCAPRVLFLAPLVQDDATADIQLLSSVGGGMVVEDTESFGGKGRIYLDSHAETVSGTTRRTAHNLRVGGNLAAGGNTIGMAYPATFSTDGMCTEKSPSLTFGNHLVLTDARASVVTGDATSGLMLDALVTFGDLRVEPGKGPLAVKTLRVGPRAELTVNQDVKVTESFLLQGELGGDLSESFAGLLHAFSVDVGGGDLDLDFAVRTKHLGLCSGTLSLVDVESTTDSTLHVTEQITVQNGRLMKDSSNPGSISTDEASTADVKDRYVLKYITPGERAVAANALEWFAPRDVIVDHEDAAITVRGDRSLPGKLTVSKGKLAVDGNLTVGTSTLYRTSATDVDKYSVMVTAGELQTEDMVVHGKVTVSGKSKLVTGGGDLQVLGRVSDGAYADGTARVMVAEEAMINLGKGTLMLGPEDIAKRDGLKNDQTTAQVDLVLRGQLHADTLHIPKGSKRTHIVSGMSAAAHTNLFRVVRFDGGKTPNDQLADNVNGRLFFNWVERILVPPIGGTDTGTTIVLDSLAVMHGGYVEIHGKKAEIAKEVHLHSGEIYVVGEALEFRDDLKLSGTGQLNVRDDSMKRSILIGGDFLQTNDEGIEGWYQWPGTRLANMTAKTVMGDVVVGADTRYLTTTGLAHLIVHGNVRYEREEHLWVTLEFRGTTSQTVSVSRHPKSALGNVIVNNPEGLLLGSDVKQHVHSTLTLRQGRIRRMSGDSMYEWTLQNVQMEEDLRGRMSVQEGANCGTNRDQPCKAGIFGGSRESYMVRVPVARALLHGSPGTGEESGAGRYRSHAGTAAAGSGGYLFPVGTEQESLSYYRPLVLQLPEDLADTTVVTASSIMVPDGVIPAWPAENIPVPNADLTLDVHADLFWKVELDEELPVSTNIRIAADGIENVRDVQRLRIVQWDCMWENPKLAGQVSQTNAGSFAVNDYLNEVLHLTQDGIGLGSCTILGIAANEAENPIGQRDQGGGKAVVQFIHNLPGSEVVDLNLGETRVGSGLSFRSATAYRPVGAGNLELTIQPVGASEEQAVTYILSLADNKNYALIIHGSAADPKLKVLETRLMSSVSNRVEVILVHGSADLGPAQVRVPMDPSGVVTILANQLMLDEAIPDYVPLAPSVQLVQVRSADQQVEREYEMDLNGYAGQTLVLNLSGTREDLTILGVDRNGGIVPVQMPTGVEDTALPTEFALHGNYPNPFNPSTRIQFDLPERSQVQVQIMDLLGREVMAIPAQEMEAGTNRSLKLNATSLASGTYLYRLITTGAEQRHVKTGRMVLVK